MQEDGAPPFSLEESDRLTEKIKERSHEETRKEIEELYRQIKEITRQVEELLEDKGGRKKPN